MKRWGVNVNFVHVVFMLNNSTSGLLMHRLNVNSDKKKKRTFRKLPVFQLLFLVISLKDSWILPTEWYLPRELSLRSQDFLKQRFWGLHLNLTLKHLRVVALPLKMRLIAEKVWMSSSFTDKSSTLSNFSKLDIIQNVFTLFILIKTVHMYVKNLVDYYDTAIYLIPQNQLQHHAITKLSLTIPGRPRPHYVR